MMHDTIEVAYLDGNDVPYLEQQDGFSVDGVTFKVRIDPCDLVGSPGRDLVEVIEAEPVAELVCRTTP